MVWVNLDRHLTRTQQHNNSEDLFHIWNSGGDVKDKVIYHLGDLYVRLPASAFHTSMSLRQRGQITALSLSLYLSLTQGSPHNTNTGRPFTQILSFQLSAPAKPPRLQMGDDRQSRGLWDLIRCIKEGVGGPKDSKSLCVTQRWSEAIMNRYKLCHSQSDQVKWVCSNTVSCQVNGTISAVDTVLAPGTMP